MTIYQSWSQLTLMHYEEDLSDIVRHVLFDESKLHFLKKFVEEYKNDISKDTLKDTATLITNVSQNTKDIINPNILDVLFEIEDFHIDIYKLKNYKYIVEHGNPKILSDITLSRHMDIQELYKHFKLHNTKALCILVKTFWCSLEEQFIQDIPKLDLIPEIYSYLKNKSLFNRIDYNALLKPLEKQHCSMSLSMMCFDEIPAEDDQELEWYAYSNRESKDYQVRLNIFRHLNVEWSDELADYMKSHRLFDFIYVQVLSGIVSI